MRHIISPLMSLAGKPLRMHKLQRALPGWRYLAMAAMIFVAAGCQQTLPPPPPGVPQLTFAQKQPLVLAAEAIDVEIAYRAPGKPPHVEHEFAPNPSDAFVDWANRRLRADGTPGVLRATLRDGRLTRRELPRGGGFKGLVTDEQRWRYDGVMQVRIEYYPAGSTVRQAYVEASASGYFTVPEGVTLNELEMEMFRLVESMINRIDREAEKNMQEYMPHIVR